MNEKTNDTEETYTMSSKQEQYYIVHIFCGGIDAVTERIDSKAEAERIAESCLNNLVLVTSVKGELRTVEAPKLYDLTSLQKNAKDLFGFNEEQTLEYIQSLYEKKLCTYPKTDSWYLPDNMEETARNVINAIFYNPDLLAENVIFNPDIRKVLSSKVSGHHAIIPTMEIIKADIIELPENERKILSLVSNRLLCATTEDYQYVAVKAILTCDGYIFTTSGKSELVDGWKFFDDSLKRSFSIITDDNQENDNLLDLSEGQTFDRVQIKLSEHYCSGRLEKDD